VKGVDGCVQNWDQVVKIFLKLVRLAFLLLLQSRDDRIES